MNTTAQLQRGDIASSILAALKSGPATAEALSKRLALPLRSMERALWRLKAAGRVEVDGVKVRRPGTRKPLLQYRLPKACALVAVGWR